MRESKYTGYLVTWLPQNFTNILYEYKYKYKYKYKEKAVTS
ncbi:hypothetical protein NEIMUCOT_06040 [Neisseria mucosa ATCC 25996]|uniref:Uncharacterized protein n=1 Tax=Neisseria mucosa (strain ATCC 25996 / DSM 4631 / NCTC 10774 / M26) TaxID=546266 RepID=D2ZZG4_NEIM2|nr:hypothetical protein NEIMUCOT_06040 [Neisseria mucosa ATCC 25996]